MLRVVLYASILSVVLGALNHFEETFQWKVIDFAWPKPEDREAAINNSEYIPANNAIAGIKLWKDKLYLTVPRWRAGVPVTLGFTHASPHDNITDPKLEAFPSWEMQKVGDCSAFQFVQSMEIDPAGRMWVLDTGRTETMTESPKALCPPRLVILDLENGNVVVRNYTFPNEVTAADDVYLNDIVLDHEDGGFAYITDTAKEKPGIIVYSVRNNTSWKVTHDSMRADPNSILFTVANTAIELPINVDGIALSPPEGNRLVYYTPLSSRSLYSIPTSVLKNQFANIGQNVKLVGNRTSQTDGMVMSRTGVLYFGLLADDAVSKWESKENKFATGQRKVSRDHNLLHWPDSFAIDESGFLWCVSNNLQSFIKSKVNINEPNYRVVKQNVGFTSYQYFENGTVPDLPDLSAMPITQVLAEQKRNETEGQKGEETDKKKKEPTKGGADKLTFASASCLAVGLMFLIY